MQAPPQRPRPSCTKPRADIAAPTCLPCRPDGGVAVRAPERSRQRRAKARQTLATKAHGRTRGGTQSRSARRMATRPRARLLRDSEAKAALRLVRVNREHVPRHAVAARCQRPHAEAHHVAADALAVVDARAGCIVHLRPAELRFECFGEIERDWPGRGRRYCRPPGLRDRAWRGPGRSLSSRGSSGKA